MDYRVLFVLVLIFFSCLSVHAGEINPSVESQPFFCRYSLTDWTPLCVQGGTGTGSTSINAENNTYFYNSTSNETYIFSNETSLFNITIGNNLTTISNYTYFTLVNITYSEMNQTPGPQGPQGVNGTPGIDGYTPVFGVDYFNGSDGVPGYTPIFGVDYFNGSDGAPGYTPIFGVDYFNGSDGAPGPQGDKGDKGDTGDTGPMNMTANMTAGPAGEAGATGPAGLDANVSSMYPVNSVYITTSTSNPNTLLGVGTWNLLTTTVATWNYVSFTPAMINNTAPATNSTTCSNIYSAGYECYRAWNNTVSDAWVTSTTGGSGWVQINLSWSRVLSNYTIYPRQDVLGSTPTAWKMNASNDGTTWATLDTQTGQSWSTTSPKSYPISNTVNYTYYRLVSSANGNGYQTGLAEIYLLEKGSTVLPSMNYWERTA